MRQMRFKRKYLLLCIICIGFVTILYEGLAFSSLERLQTVQFNDCNPFGVRNAGPNTTRKKSDVADSFEGIEAKIVLKEFSGFHDAGVESLENKSVVNTVHYVWCGNKTFEFTHYLSMLSVWKTLQPDIIEFHTEFPPITDKYNQWFDEIVRKIPGLVIRSLPRYWDGDDKGCGFWFGLAVLDDRGGIYVDESVLLQSDVLSFREKEATMFFSKRDTVDTEHYFVAMAMAVDHVPEFRKFRKDFNPQSIYYKDYQTCPSLTLESKMNKSACNLLTSPVKPVDIFHLNTTLGQYTRKLVYGSEAAKKENNFLPGKIPKIVHYVWFGAKEMDFMMYLSMLSTLFILNPLKVFIYTDGYLTGLYLERVKRDKRVVIVKREKPEFIYGKNVLYSQHRSDIVRAEVLLKYGGIYMDWDVLWLRNVDDVINKGYDAVANFDHMPHAPFPEVINLGVLLSKPKSTFIKRWQDSLYNYKSKDFLYNALELPYKTYEKFPEYIHIERRLQVMCFHLKCHPAFHPQYKMFSDDQPFDWKSDVYSIHFTYPDPPELASEGALKNGTGRFADIGRYISQHSSKLD